MSNPLDLFRLDGRVALITGGGGGLGEVFAETLAGAGADLVLLGRRKEVVDAMAEKVAAKTGRRAVGVSADVTNAEQVAQAQEEALKAFDKIDIIVNNAGVNLRRPTVDWTAEEWQQVLQVNLTGPFLVSKTFAPKMLENGWGRVINVSSMFGLVGFGERPAYTAAKGGLIQLTRTMALEWAPKGVTVNAIAPGPFETEMNRPLIENPVLYRSFADKIPLGRWGRLPEIAGPMLFLASEASSFMTGSVLTLDGGWTAQ
jgi:NAD(P)-dependent dehydrogenase (short-subunit alcohol dehydrogenase family)